MNIDKTVPEQNTDKTMARERYFLNFQTGVQSGLPEESWRHGTSQDGRSVDHDIFELSLLVPLQHGEDGVDLVHCHLPRPELHLLQALDGSNQNLGRD